MANGAWRGDLGFPADGWLGVAWAGAMRESQIQEAITGYSTTNQAPISMWVLSATLK